MTTHADYAIPGFDFSEYESHKSTEAASASALLVSLEAAWKQIQKHYEKLPDVVIVIGPVSANGKFSKYGHYAGLRWAENGVRRAEVLIAAEGLDRGPRAVFETLLHESVHAYQDVIGEQGTSRQGRYHNKTFRRRAEEFGLVVKSHPQIGAVTPDITDGCAARYADAIFAIEDALKITRTVEPKTTDGSRNGVALVCGCERKIRVSESVAEEGPIVCGRCAEEFLPEGSKGAKHVGMPKDADLADFLRRALGQ